MSKVKSESWFWAQPFFILQRATFTPVDLYTKNLYTRSLLHQRPCKPKNSRRLPQQNASTPETFYTKGPLRRCQTALHQKKFTPDSEYVCTKNLLHKNTFNTRDTLHSFTLDEGFLHQKAFTPEPFYTSRPSQLGSQSVSQSVNKAVRQSIRQFVSLSNQSISQSVN